MKKLLFLSIFLAAAFGASAQGIGIGTPAPHSSAMLEISSTTKGMLVPRMTTAQRTAIGSPAQGLMVYDSDTQSFWYYNGNTWTNFSAGGQHGWSITGNSGTDASHFIGTTDAVPLKFGVDNRRYGLLDRFGNIFLGDSAGGKHFSGGAYGSNIGIGRGALRNNLYSAHNIAIGDSSMSRSDSYGGGTFNTAVGMYTLKLNQGQYNTAYGWGSLENNIYGTENTAVGKESLMNNGNGHSNTAIGSTALKFNKASGNVAVGSYSMESNVDGQYNVSVGVQALQLNVDGDGSVAVGLLALRSNTTGSRNIAIGFSALQNNSVCSSLVAVGDSALLNNGLNATLSYHSQFNTAVGSKALLSNTNGYQNTATGYFALNANTSGASNTALGSKALFANSTGSENTAIGRDALNDNTTGLNNTAVGSVSLFNNSSGGNNTAIGLSTLSVNTTGSGNTGLGYNADVSVGNLSNATAIGNNATVNASNKIRLGNSSVTVIEGQVAYTTSDGRFKQNIKDNVPGLDFITSLKPYTYQYKSYDMERFMNQQNPDRQAKLRKSDFAEAESMVHMGFIAKDVEKLVKEKGYNLSVVHAPTNATDNYSIAYGELVVPLVKAVQEQQAIIQEQQKQIDDLKRMVNQLLKK